LIATRRRKKRKTSHVGEHNSISSVWESILKHLETLGRPLQAIGATEEEVLATEERMGYHMPLQLKELYLLTNGLSNDEVYIPGHVNFKRIQNISKPRGKAYRRFYRSMGIWNVVTGTFLCMDNCSGGLVYDWELIHANSLAEYLQRWNVGLKEQVKRMLELRYILQSSSSTFPVLPEDITILIIQYAIAPPFWYGILGTMYSERERMDQSSQHRFWCQRFRAAYVESFSESPP